MERKRQGTDIIIPVFNGYEDVIACMESIAAHTNLKTNGVIFVNDASTDEKIMPLLSIYAEKYGANVSVIDSRKNQGFSASVNIGMKASDRDVLLLNSDTIVTEGWLDRMRTCAYSDASIATVTPFSNCATRLNVTEYEHYQVITRFTAT